MSVVQYIFVMVWTAVSTLIGYKIGFDHGFKAAKKIIDMKD